MWTVDALVCPYLGIALRVHTSTFTLSAELETLYYPHLGPWAESAGELFLATWDDPPIVHVLFKLFGDCNRAKQGPFSPLISMFVRQCACTFST